jgi:hypothetical protein
MPSGHTGQEKQRATPTPRWAQENKGTGARQHLVADWSKTTLGRSLASRGQDNTGEGRQRDKERGKRLQCNLIRVACGKKLLVRCFDELQMPTALFLDRQNVNQAVGQVHVWCNCFCCTITGMQCATASKTARQTASKTDVNGRDTVACAPADNAFRHTHACRHAHAHACPHAHAHVF